MPDHRPDHLQDIDVDIRSESAPVSLLLRRIPAVPPDTPAAEVFEMFVGNPDLIALPVVADGVPTGSINRKKMVESFARPYTRELFGRKPIAMLMDTRPLVVDAHTDLDDVSRMIMESDMQYMYDGFIITADGLYAGMGTGHDLMRAITERTQAHLYRLAHYDALTGLPNRLLFRDRLNQAMSQAHRNERLVAVMLLDLDRFKAINDTLGHSVGDLLLKAIALRLGASVREGDTVARLGGDEFVVILPDISYIRDAAAVARKILDLLHEPFELRGHEVFVTTSIGISIYPFDEDIESLIKNADTAMYQAKERGGNNYHFYTADMNAANMRRLALENGLRRALERNELALHYQPQVDITSGAIVGVEALLRWHHPELGMIPPADFIPLAEETGLIIQIGAWVLRSACAQNRAWQSAGYPPMLVTVNLSARQFGEMELLDTVHDALHDAGLEPHYLELELTENVLMQHTQTTITVLDQLHARGIRLSVDDFGTGYSSLSYLKRFPIDTLKIDRSFVCDINADADDAAIVKAITAMGHSLDIRVVAEGVETEEQLQFLRELRCNEVQGFYFSPPVPAAEVEHLLAASTRRASVA